VHWIRLVHDSIQGHTSDTVFVNLRVLVKSWEHFLPTEHTSGFWV